MNKLRSLSIAVLSLVAAATVDGQQSSAPQSSGQNPDAFRFKSGVELVNVTATVADSSGRFVPGLTRDDFIVFEDDVRQTVSQFSAERVPVSLGIALDTSGSMAGEKIDAARGALDRFLSDLLDEQDEVFVYRFSDTPILLHGWTSDKASMARVLDRVIPEGGTALYDAVSDAVPMAARGRNQKKAVVIISDGNDTSSHIGMRELKQQIRQSEVLVYAVGIDSDTDDTVRRPPQGIPRRPQPVPFPFPPGRRPGGGRFPIRPQIFGGNGGSRSWPGDERVNVAALRDMTDDSGGRTEIVRYTRDIDPATASIADELSKQYYLGYSPTAPKDGRWHAIRVELKTGSYRVRARKGYIAN